MDIIKKLLMFFGLIFITKQLDAIPVTPNINLTWEEHSYITTKQPYTHTVIEKMVGYRCVRVPRIALSLSGGGYRSMISSLGFLLGAQKIGLWNALLYTASLSGGSWLIGPLIAYDNHTLDYGSYLNWFRAHLKETVQENLLHGINGKAIEALLQKKYDQGQSLHFVDIWGGILANKLLRGLPNDGQEVYLSWNQPNPLQFPFPLFSAVIANHQPYQWLEVTPFSVASNFLNATIPYFALGNIFNAGVSTTSWPEQRLGYLLGMLGSPYAFTIGDIVRLLAEEVSNPTLKKILWAIADWSIFYHGRPVPAQPYNFTYGMPTFTYGTETHLDLIDAGFDFNEPLPPLLHPQRQVDIIFMCDASSDASLEHYPQLKLAATYAATHGLRFPPVDRPFYRDTLFLVFKDPYDQSIPTIVYFPNQIPDPTLKLEYSEKEFEDLCTYMEKAVLTSQQSIINVIKEKTTPYVLMLPPPQKKTGLCTIL